MTDNSLPLKLRRDAVIKAIGEAALAADRPAETIQLLAVSKTRPADEIREMASLGQRAFGENYLQEALEKIETLADLDLEWHFIGPIQSNKTQPIAAHFDWVHSVDRLKVARRLAEQRPAGMAPLNICLQVNSSGEVSKSGITFDELPALAEAVADLPSLRLRGLMTIPAPCSDPAAQHEPFRRLREAMEGLNRNGFALDTLSMGMSGDLAAAIAEGATMVRIGTALFGPRAPR